jgi:hypothetical protein
MISPNSANALLLQYETPLPEDFDIKAVRERIREIAPAFDRMAGLLVKFYGLNIRPEAPANEYVSTYLWQNPLALREFLEGDRFGNYTEVFARPSARTWLLHEIVGEFDELTHTRFLLKQIVGIPRKAKVGHSLETWAKRPLPPSTIVRILGLDSVTWEIIEFTALSDRPDLNHAINAHLYNIVHVSKPSRTSHVTE